MKKEYMTFVRDLKKLPQGQEIEIIIKDLTPGPNKYDTLNVKAILSSSPAKLPDGDVLRIRSEIGYLFPKPWAIKITKELKLPMPGAPYGYTSPPEK